MVELPHTLPVLIALNPPMLATKDLAPILGVLGATWFSYQWIVFRRTRAKVDNIPTIGSDGFIGSYLSAWKYFIVGHKMIEEGYKKYKGSAFKVATFETATRWMIVVSGRETADELRKAPENELSLQGETKDFFQMEYVFGNEITETDWYHIGVIRGPLTRNIWSRFPDILDEVQVTLGEKLPLSEDWTSVPAMDTFVGTISRVVNRFLFPTLQAHRNPEFLRLQEKYAVELMLTGTLVGLFPEPFRPLIGGLLSRVRGSLKKMKAVLGPTIEERLEKDAQFGKDWEGKPASIMSEFQFPWAYNNDYISWLLEQTPPEQRNADDLVVRVLKTEFAGIHTTSIVLVEALFNLAARREYLQPLREEVESSTKEHGWTKEAFYSMRKLDSFIKESSRIGGLGSLAVRRKAVNDFTFSNGITIPAGYTVSLVARPASYDPANFKDPETFDGFRFATEDGEEAIKTSFVASDIKFLLFGAGRHLCPGRFLAVAELKAIISHILLNYDVRLPEDARTVPDGVFFGSNRGLDTRVQLQFRKRRA